MLNTLEVQGTLPEAKHLKMDGWNTSFHFLVAYVQGLCLFQGVYLFHF